MEVLVRLQDEDGHEVPPSDFVRAAERYRLMGLVDRWVVQTTLAALGRGAIPVPATRSVAINISGQTLGDTQFLEFVVECLDSTGVDARAGVLRDHRERGRRQHGSRAPLRRRAARHGLPVRAR